MSKPLAPPWNDSGKNWARDIATYASPPPLTHHILIPKDCHIWDTHAPGVIADPIYASGGQFAPRLRDKARTLLHMLHRSCDVVHFCFAPNRRTNWLAQFATSTLRRKPSIHTILSVPASFRHIQTMLFSERLVCVSHNTATVLRHHGLSDVHVVPAAIPVSEPLRTQAPERIAAFAQRMGLDHGEPLVVFPGDYEFSRAADVFAEAVMRLWRDVEARFVFACRIKQATSLEREAALRRQLHEPLRAGRVSFVREVDDMEALLALATVVTLPAESTYAKMDIPLVLLEALAQRTPIVIADTPPLREVLGVRPMDSGGLTIPPLDGKALAEALRMLLMEQGVARDLGQAGREHVLKHHNASRNCRHYADIYASLR
ncbi:MAG: glycosyltransferase family 4 protein [Myxococcota bacterium]